MGSRTRHLTSEPVKSGNPPRQDRNEMSGALYGVEEPRDADAPGHYNNNEPLEDPLDDWPDIVAEADRWLSEHGAGRKEHDRWNEWGK